MTFLMLVVPILIIILIGYLCSRSSLFSTRFADDLAVLLFYIVMPVTLFLDVAQIPISQVLHWPFLIAYFLASCTVIVITILLSYYKFQRKAADLVINAMASMQTNTAYLAIPIFLLLFQDITPVAGIILVQAIFNFLTLFSLEYFSRNQQLSNWRLAGSVLWKTPLLIGIILGLLVSSFHIELPMLIKNTSEILQKSASFLALFALGFSLSHREDTFSTKLRQEVTLLIVLKNIIHPLLALLIGKIIFQLSGFWLMSLILMAAMPTAKNCFIFAKKYHVGSDRANRVVIVTTIVSIVFINIILLLTPKTAFANTEQNTIQNQLMMLEQASGGRLGVYAIDTGNKAVIAYHADQRFPLCSTAKLMVVAAILKKSMHDPTLLSKIIHYDRASVVVSAYAPITSQHLNAGMTVAALCEAAIRYSDNAAANLLLQQIGGPQAVNAFAKSIGDQKFNLVRVEPQLNSAIPGDERDTATPKSMSQSLMKILFGEVLAHKQRQLLIHWLIENTTGDAKIRAGVPEGWVVGDKTGSGDYGTSNDVAVIWPGKCKPIILSIYYTQSTKRVHSDKISFAKVTREIIQSFTQDNACLATLN